MAAPNVFAGNSLDRTGDRRGDESWLAGRIADPLSRTMVLWNGQPLVEEAEGVTRLTWLPMDLASHIAPGDEPRLFLGLDGEAAVFALDLEDAADPTAGPLAGRGAFRGLRDLAVRLESGEAGIAATAKAVFEWRRRHRFCAACGGPSAPADAGWKRTCTVCAADHFPRTDPVVIMLPTAGERCLLGHNTSFRPGLFSTLAGFVEPGETIEQACARELREEAGLTTTAAVYHSCQPWPFPSSLMIGLIAEVDGTDAKADQTELEEIRWFTREEARALLDGRLEGLVGPMPFAIAHQLIRSWIDGR